MTTSERAVLTGGDADPAPDGGSGLVCSRDPVTGSPGLTGTYRPGGTGADLVDEGGQDITPFIDAEPWGAALRDAVTAAENRLMAPVRVEFTVERGRLRTTRSSALPLRGAALLNTLAASLRRGRLSAAQALARIGPADLAAARAGNADLTGVERVARGSAVAPGFAGGVAVFSRADAVAAEAEGRQAVLIVAETRPEDIAGLLASVAVVTERGGHTSHSAVVARGLGRPAIAALADASVDAAARCLRPAHGDPVRAGDPVTVDGHTGVIYRGLATGEPATPAEDGHGWLDDAVGEVIGGAPGLQVRVNADTADDVSRGVGLGATGVGLCRIEHMFLGRRQRILERVLTARPGPDLGDGLAELHTVLRAELRAMLAAADGLPVAVRLLDPPRHEFLPDAAALEAQAAVARERGEVFPGEDRLAIVRRLREHNPMIGVRGVRLGILVPQLTVVQLRALVEAVIALREAGRDPRPELLVPMVSDAAELDVVVDLLGDVCAREGRTRAELGLPVGAMIETPRAAVLARTLAGRAEFLSLGTNDLTALTWGLSRDDGQSLLRAYRDLGLVSHSPFERFDVAGVGELVRTAVAAAREARPGIRIGACGEHAAEPAAVGFFGEIGIDYVSCSAPRVPTARLLCAQARLSGGA